MGYQSLYRKYRPKNFKDMVGQKIVVEVIKKSIIKEKIGHAYLFTGPRGTGKTSMAKLLAQAVNCESLSGDVCGQCDNCNESKQGTHPDIIEIDAASNNGVEEIRKLIDRVKYTPILGRYKIYIIDEVHMLSQGAFNALLKTLEEPPAHVIFVLATTEIHKVLPTIISRCQRFDFTHIADSEIERRLDYILTNEDIKAESGVSSAIAKVSGGGLRNALTILEQAIVYSDNMILLNDVYEITGLLSSEEQINLFQSAIDDKMDEYAHNLDIVKDKSHNLDLLSVSFAESLKDSIVLEKTKLTHIGSYGNRDFIEYLSRTVAIDKRYQLINVILEYVQKMKFTQNQSSYFDLMMLQIFDVLSKEKSKEIISAKEGIDEQITNIEDHTNYHEPVDKLVPPKIKEHIKAKENYAEDKSKRNVPRETSGSSSERNNKKIVYQILEGLKLVSFMVSANKKQREDDQKAIDAFDIHMSDIRWARSYRLVSEADLVLSSNSFIVLSFDEDYKAYESLNKLGNKELRDFFEHLTGIKRYVFATTQKKFKEGVQNFISLHKANDLPEGINIVYNENEEENEDEVMIRATALFGEKLKIE